MKNFYYLFWSDAIHRFIKHNGKNDGWQRKQLVLISWVFTMGIFTTSLWIKYFTGIENKPGVFRMLTSWGREMPLALDMGLVFVIIYAVNYLLIFWKDRYLSFIREYPLGRFNYILVVSMTLLAYFLLSMFLYGYLTS